MIYFFIPVPTDIPLSLRRPSFGFVQAIPREQWRETLLSAGVTDNTAENLSNVTQAVIDGLVVPE